MDLQVVSQLVVMKYLEGMNVSCQQKQWLVVNFKNLCNEVLVHAVEVFFPPFERMWQPSSPS